MNEETRQALISVCQILDAHTQKLEEISSTLTKTSERLDNLESFRSWSTALAAALGGLSVLAACVFR